MAAKPTYYITTPIYYPSGEFHMGHAYTTVAADFLARYKRQCGYDTWFLTGLDEHGLKIMRAAAAAGLSPREWVDAAHAKITALWRLLEISHDDFLRTTEPRHAKVVGALFTRLYEQGDIYKGAYKGWYCAPCETFLLDRGLDAGNCPDCGRAVEWVTEEAYFFRLARYGDRWLEYVAAHPDFIQPAARRNEMINFVRGGLEDLCVSRTSFGWGIKVPFDPDHVIYVWLDALTNYVSALGYGEPGSRYERYWPADVHLMAKEIVRFHAVIWPIVLMAAGLPLPQRVFGHGWLVLDGEKMSKSRGNVADPVRLVEKYGLDPIRYYLLRALPFGADGAYSEDALVLRTNVELVNDIGNLLHRTLAMVERFAAGRVPRPEPAGDRPLRAQAAGAWRDYQASIDQLDLPGALGAVLALVGRANKYIEEQLPWDLAKDPAQGGRLRTVLYDLLETLRITAVLLKPALRRAPDEMLRQLGLDPARVDASLPGAVAWGGLAPGLSVRRGEPLFPRIEREEPAAAEEEDGRDREAGPPGKAEPAAGMGRRGRKGRTGAGGPVDQGQAGGRAAGTGQVTFADFAKLDLRVAKVLAAERVAGADRLLKLEVDAGDGARGIVAGVAEHYTPSELVGKQIVVVANLAPARIRGEESAGMLLAASYAGELCLVVPERPIEPGAKVK